MTARTLLAPLLLLAATPGLAGAQLGLGGKKVEATLHARAEGDLVRLALELDVERGFHLYHTELGHPLAIGKPTRVRLSGGGDIRWSDVRFPEPHRYDQSDIAGDGVYILGHEGRIVAYAAGRLGEGAGLEGIEADIAGLTCQDDGSCVPYADLVEVSGPGSDELFAAFPDDLVPPPPPEEGASGEPEEVDPAAGTVEAPPSPRGPPADIDPAAVEFPEFRPQTDQTEHGLLVWMLLAFVAGMILNVMPCVLPVISIKVLSFVQQAGEDRKRIFQLGLAFAGGILIVFLALAALAIWTGMSWGEQFQSEGFLVTMIAIVFALSLSLFGVYEIGVPQQVGGLATGTREGMGDAFFKGMLATVLATPCSGPFLGSTLTWTLSQPAGVIFAIFVMLGLGMALPYVLLTANPAFLKFVPRPGPWMDTFKQAMGFLLLATVVYLMISLRQDNLLFTAAFLLFVALGCWWWGRFATLGQSLGKRLAHLAVAAAIVGGGAQASFVGFKGMFTVDPEGDHLAWVDFDPERFVAHLEEGRTVFVDFTADWCPNCKYNEVFVFESPEVREVVERKGVVCMKADITNDDPWTDMLERLLHSLGGRSIPYLAVFPGDRPYEPIAVPDVVTVSQMVEIFESCPDSLTARR